MGTWRTTAGWQPILIAPWAGLIKDLKQRGMLEETLIVGCTEFGRTPWQDANPNGRDHHAKAFTCFLAGGGVKAGTSYGKSDEVGDGIAENPVHIHDFHATILHLLGLNHEELTSTLRGARFPTHRRCWRSGRWSSGLLSSISVRLPAASSFARRSGKTLAGIGRGVSEKGKQFPSRTSSSGIAEIRVS
jgi:hypothetical protein